MATPSAANGITTRVLSVVDKDGEFERLAKRLGLGNPANDALTNGARTNDHTSDTRTNHDRPNPQSDDSPALQNLRLAAEKLRTSNIPVAFPTETVYGLGADATRSEAVRGIYTAKGRPSDNPLIVHISDMGMLRRLLRPSSSSSSSSSFDASSGATSRPPQTPSPDAEDPLPPIYKPLITAFWPGPLTIILPLPTPPSSPLAPEVTAGLPTFGVRMPSSPLAQLLIFLSSVPIAAPSANASTKPSPTLAEHVLQDMDGRIEVILDGGAGGCDVGVESTIVDGLGDVPVVLRPGGVSLEAIRTVKGWEGCEIGYKDFAEGGDGSGERPRAPGMKYKHYSPRARVVLVEGGGEMVVGDLPGLESQSHVDGGKVMTNGTANGMDKRKPVIGVVRTRQWKRWAAWEKRGSVSVATVTVQSPPAKEEVDTSSGIEDLIVEADFVDAHTGDEARLIDVHLGIRTQSIAHYLFIALRELDKRNADIVYVEGIEEGQDAEDQDLAAAIMNRLRKASSTIVNNR